MQLNEPDQPNGRPDQQNGPTQPAAHVLLDLRNAPTQPDVLSDQHDYPSEPDVSHQCNELEQQDVPSDQHRVTAQLPNTPSSSKQVRFERAANPSAASSQSGDNNASSEYPVATTCYTYDPPSSSTTNQSSDVYDQNAALSTSPDDQPSSSTTNQDGDAHSQDAALSTPPDSTGSASSGAASLSSDELPHDADKLIRQMFDPKDLPDAQSPQAQPPGPPQDGRPGDTTHFRRNESNDDEGEDTPLKEAAGNQNTN